MLEDGSAAQAGLVSHRSGGWREVTVKRGPNIATLSLKHSLDIRVAQIKNVIVLMTYFLLSDH